MTALVGDVLDKIEARGEIRGKVLAFREVGLSDEVIQEKTGLCLEEIEKILSEEKRNEK